MAVDTEALRVREIEREGAFTPIQFGDIARGAIGIGQQFEASEEAREAARLKREQAAQMQKILNGGDAAIMQIFGQLPDEQKKLVFQGNQDILKSVLAGKDGKINVLKAIGRGAIMAESVKQKMFREKDKMIKMYYDRKMSLTDIGKVYGCSRQYVQMILII